MTVPTYPAVALVSWSNSRTYKNIPYINLDQIMTAELAHDDPKEAAGLINPVGYQMPAAVMAKTPLDLDLSWPENGINQPSNYINLQQHIEALNLLGDDTTFLNAVLSVCGLEAVPA